VLLHRLPRVRTPGGWHVYYRCRVIEGNQKLATVSPEEAQRLRGDRGKTTIIETRGEGGYVLAPGCPARCHPDRGTYRRVEGPPLPGGPRTAPGEREVLRAAARLLTRHAEPAHAWDRPAEGGGLRPGDDLNARGPDWPEILPAGWVRVGT